MHVLVSYPSPPCQHLPCIETSIPPPSTNLTLLVFQFVSLRIQHEQLGTNKISFPYYCAAVAATLRGNGPSKCGGCDETSKRRWFHVLQVTDLSPAPISIGVVGLPHRKGPRIGRTLKMARGTRKSVQFDTGEGDGDDHDDDDASKDRSVTARWDSIPKLGACASYSGTAVIHIWMLARLLDTV